MKVYNRYILFARYIPALITVTPLSLIYFFATQDYSEYDLSEYLSSTTFMVGLSATFIFGYLLSMVVRELGTYLERKYFISKKGFPTSYMMLYSDDKLPTQVKTTYGTKIFMDFQLVRLTEQQERANEREALKILHHASRSLSTKYQQDQQLKEANIAYGFSRNVSGGLFISLPSALTGIITGAFLDMPGLILWSAVLCALFVTLLVFHKKWILRNSEKYAEKLLALYLV